MNKGKKRITYWEFDFMSAPRKRVRYVNPKTYLDRVIPVCLFIFTTTVSLTLWCGTGNSISDFAIRAEGVENITQTQPEMVYSEPAITPTPSPSLEPSPSPSIAPKQALITAYSCGGIKTEAERKMNCPNGITSDGTIPIPYKTMACDRANLGKTFWIEGVGDVKCTDTGGAIKGAGRFDLYVEDIQEAYQWGKQTREYKVKE